MGSLGLNSILIFQLRGGRFIQQPSKLILWFDTGGWVFVKIGGTFDDFVHNAGFGGARDQEHDLAGSVDERKGESDAIDRRRQNSRRAPSDPSAIFVERGFARKERRGMAVIAESEQDQIDLGKVVAAAPLNRPEW